MLQFLASGITFGLAAGLSPGPLLAFLVAQTLRYGMREGIRVALAPVLTDAPIVALTLLGLSQLSSLDIALGIVSVIGGLYLGILGLQSLRSAGGAIEAAESSPRSIRRAIAINLLNPHVYVFWATVGAPTVMRAAKSGIGSAVAFVACFYLLLCGSKVLLAVLIHRSRGFLQGRAYTSAIQVLGVALIGFGVWLVRDGVQLLGF